VSQEWYVYKNQQQQGPFSWEELCQQARSGMLQPGDHVWKHGMSGWTPARQVQGLAPATPPSPPPPPPPSAGPAPPPPPIDRPAPPPTSAPQPAPPPAARPASPPASVPDSEKQHQAAAAPRKKKGCLIAIIVVLVLLLGGGAIAVYLVFFSGGAIPVTLPGKSTVVGSWHGLEESEELYLNFQVDGKLHIASPSEGYWTTVEYATIERPGANGTVTYLEFYDGYADDWEVVAIIEFKGNKLILIDYDSYDGDDQIMELDRISDKRFEDVKSLLLFEEWY
jgi:hypothetical protein